MAEDVANSNPPSRPNFLEVITEMHQTFTKKNIGGTLDEYSSFWTESDSVSKTASVLTQFSSNSVPEFRPQTRRPHKPKYEQTPTMAPISTVTIQHALRNLRPVSHPDDFPVVTSRSCLLSTVPSPIDSPRNPKNVPMDPIHSPLTPESVTLDHVPSLRTPKIVTTDLIHSPLTPESVTLDHVPSLRTPKIVTTDLIHSPRTPESVTLDHVPSLRTPKIVTTDLIPSPRTPKSVTTDPVPSPRTPQSVSTDPVPSPRFFIGSSTNSITSDESEILNSNTDVLRSIRRSRELTRSVAAYLRSVGVCVEPPPEQDYPPTTETHYEFHPTPEEEDTRSIHQAEEHELTPEVRAAPQSPDVTIQRFAILSSGDRPRVTPTILEQILEAKKNLKPVHRNEDERNYNIMDLHKEVNSENKENTSKEKKSRQCRLLCCFRSPQDDE